MKVKITIEVPMNDLGQYMQEYFECNGKALTIEEAKESYIDYFIADKNDFIDRDEIKVYFT